MNYITEEQWNRIQRRRNAWGAVFYIVGTSCVVAGLAIILHIAGAL